MTALKDWTTYFKSLGISCGPVPSNPSAVQLLNVAGCPIFRGVETVDELENLHTKARELSSKMERIVVLGMPFNHPQTLATLPGNILLPKARAYCGHTADTFSSSGHLIENEFLKSIKREVLAVIDKGTKCRTPLCDWAIKMLGQNWKYGTPSSLAQLDSMLGLLMNEVDSIGHVRSRMLSFGRGTGDALFLPIPSVVLPTNHLNQMVDPADMRFISLEAEIKHYDASRVRIHPVFSDKFLSITAHIDQRFAVTMGYTTNIGSSTLGKKQVAVTI